MRKPLSKEDLQRRKQAIADGKGTYTRTDGQVWRIRNRNNPRLKRRFGGQGGTDEVASSRDRNRDSKTRLGITRRTRNERISTPRVKDRKKQTADYEKAKQEAKAAGKDHHHKTPVYLTGNAKAQMDRRSRRRYDLRMQRAGTPQGNTAENVSAETRGNRGTHRQAHKEGEAVQDRLRDMEKKNISPSLNRRSRRAQLAENRPQAPTGVRNVGSLLEKARNYSTTASGLNTPRVKTRLGEPIKIPAKLGVLSPGGMLRSAAKEIAEEAITHVGMNLTSFAPKFTSSSNTPDMVRKRL
jgi:hypothetical protein